MGRCPPATTRSRCIRDTRRWAGGPDGKGARRSHDLHALSGAMPARDRVSGRFKFHVEGPDYAQLCAFGRIATSSTSRPSPT